MDAQKSLVLSIVGKDETKQAFDSVNKNLNITEKQAFNFGKTMDGISSSLKSFGTTMSVAVTAPLVALGGFAIQSGAQLDSLQGAYGRMTKVMGIDADALMSKMKEVSQGTISQSDLILSANKGMSLGVIKSVDDMATIMEIARVKGQNMGLSMTQAFNDLVTGLGRGSAMILDNLGITIKVGEVNEAYAKSLGKTVAELTASEQKQALVNAVVSQGKQELQSMGQVAQTNQEKIAQMTARLTDLKAELGQKLLPYAVKFAETLLEWSKKIDQLTPNQQKMLLIGGALLAVIGPLSLALSGLITIITTLGTVFGFIGSAITALIPILAGISLPVLAIIAGVVALIAIGYLVVKNWEEISAFAVKIWGEIATFFSNIFATIGQIFNSFWTGVKDFFIGIWNGIVEGLKTAINFMVGLLDLLFQAFGTDLVSFLQAFSQTVLNIWNGIAEFTKTIWQGIVDFFTLMLQGLKFIWDNTFGGMFTSLAGIMGSIVAKINEVFNWIAPKITSALTAIKTAWDGIWNGMSQVTGGVVDTIKGYIDGLKNWVSDAVDWLIGKFKVITDFASKIGSSVSGFANKITSSGSKITGLATGGFAQPGRTYLVGENGPELFSSDRGGTITPNNRLAGGGTNITIQITGNTLLDAKSGEKIGDMIIKRLKLSNAL